MCATMRALVLDPRIPVEVDCRAFPTIDLATLISKWLEIHLKSPGTYL